MAGYRILASIYFRDFFLSASCYLFLTVKAREGDWKLKKINDSYPAFSF